MFVRMAWVYALAAVALLLSGESIGQASTLVDFALVPTGWAILALIAPFGGGWWWAQNMGGREPSAKEWSAFRDAFELLRDHGDGELRLPSRWFVLDTPQPDAAVCGETLMLSRGLIESEFLPAVLAHELGHLATSDGKLTAAINRLVLRPVREKPDAQPRQRGPVAVGTAPVLLTITFFGGLLWLVRASVRFARGGFGLRITAPFWGSYWREREYLADQHAAQLGQAEELADFLEIHALIHDHPVPLIWLTEHTHPPTELRIDRLRKAGEQIHAVAPGPEPVKAAPAGPPAAGPDGPALTEPDPSAEESLRSAGMALPTFGEDGGSTCL